MKTYRWIVLIILLCGLVSCKTFWSQEDEEESGPFKGQTAKQLYRDANKELKRKDYASAIRRYEALDTMYPFNDDAEQAQLNLIYAYYRNEDYPSAAAAADRFIHLYPRASHVDYAYYMKGLADFSQVRGNITRFVAVDESWRDPGTQSQAYADFAILIQKFPESKYKNNALQRMIYLRNMFAQTELNLAHYYMERKMYVAALERVNYLIKTYPQAPSVSPAMRLAYRANRALGFDDAANDLQKIYEATYHRPIKTGRR